MIRFSSLLAVKNSVPRVWDDKMCFVPVLSEGFVQISVHDCFAASCLALPRNIATACPWIRNSLISHIEKKTKKQKLASKNQAKNKIEQVIK